MGGHHRRGHTRERSLRRTALIRPSDRARESASAARWCDRAGHTPEGFSTRTPLRRPAPRDSPTAPTRARASDRAPARLGHQRFAPAGQPLRPPVVHCPERDLEHRRDLLASPARHQRGHRPQPKGLLHRRRQLPCVPHQFTHAGINDPEHLPFRINSRSPERDGSQEEHHRNGV